MVGMQFFLAKAAAEHVMRHAFPSHIFVTVVHTIPIDKIIIKKNLENSTAG